MGAPPARRAHATGVRPLDPTGAPERGERGYPRIPGEPVDSGAFIQTDACGRCVALALQQSPADEDSRPEQQVVEVRGVEPLTSAVRRQRSTTELHPPSRSRVAVRGGRGTPRRGAPGRFGGPAGPATRTGRP